MRNYIYISILSVIFLISLFGSWNYTLILIAVLTILLMVLDRLGKGIVLRELIGLHTMFVCLAMPSIGFIFYNKSNPLALMWVRYMPVSEETYFPFALPACLGFVIMLCWPFYKSKAADEGENLNKIIIRLREILVNPRMFNTGVILILVGVVMFFISKQLPSSFKFISLLFYFSSFAGLLYIYYSPPRPNRILILILFSLFLAANALRSGMFTVIVYMGITIFSLLFIGRSIQLWKKMAIFGISIFILLIVQSVKPEYRKQTWWSVYKGNKALLFMNLAFDRIKKGDFFTEEAFFPIYYRTNQGYNVGLVMKRIPSLKEHDGGQNLLMSFAASLVPRFLWPDKPQAGGKFNMKYYTGITLKGGWSTNIGPLGEAYGSFGNKGGVLYMFFLGFLIRAIYKRVFILSSSIPLLICWIPVIFYQVTYSAETDSLQIFNSLVKSSLFVFLIYKIKPEWFGLFSSLRKTASKPLRMQSV